MTDTLTLTGFVATPLRHSLTKDGVPITSFRLASTQRRFDRTRSLWVDAGTNWFTISCFRQLALNVGSSINRGERVVVTGKLHIRDWTSGEKHGINVEVEAEAIGHDLAWGTAAYTRGISTAVAESDATDTTDSPGTRRDGDEPDDDAGALADVVAIAEWPTAVPGQTGVQSGTRAGQGDEPAADSEAELSVPF